MLKLEKSKQELRSKDDALHKLEENYQNLEAKAKGKDQLLKNQQGKVNELESQLESKTELIRQLEKQLLQLSEGMKGKEETCSNVQQKVALQICDFDIIFFPCNRLLKSCHMILLFIVAKR